MDQNLVEKPRKGFIVLLGSRSQKWQKGKEFSGQCGKTFLWLNLSKLRKGKNGYDLMS